jgi:predicted Rossmann fold flavoprotein
MTNVIIIGGGASGLACAIELARKNINVTILERNNICGKKLLLTGNGKCNYWNLIQDNNNYHSSDKTILDSILNDNNKNKVIDFFNSLNIICKNKDGYLYPNSNESKTILESLLLEAKLNNIKIKYNTLVNNIIKENNKFIIYTNNEILKCDKLVIAAGSCSAPKTGSDGIGYKLASNFKHTIIKPLPALVQLISSGFFLKEWNGVRQDAVVSLYQNNELIQKEKGEIQLTDYGISGICVLQLSSNVSRGLNLNKKEEVSINFLPMLNKKELEEFFEKNNNKTIYETLCHALNSKLVNVILEVSKLDKSSNWHNIEINQQNNIINNIIAFKLNIIGTKGFDNAQVTSGGVSLKEVNPKTLESKLVKDLYFTGEILDCDGACGGYNLGFAWLSGLLVGNSIKND